MSHPDLDSEESDLTTTQRRGRPQTWRERHALSLLGAIMAIMFATVIAVQVGC